MRNSFLKDPELVIEDLNINTDLALKLQQFSKIVPDDGMVNVGDKLVPVEELIDKDFGDYSLKEVLLTMASLKEAHQERVNRVKAELKYVEALCIAQKKDNDDGSTNVFLTKKDAVKELTERLKTNGQEITNFDEDRLEVNSQLFFDNDTNEYFYIVDEIVDEMSDEHFDRLWKGDKA